MRKEDLSKMVGTFVSTIIFVTSVRKAFFILLFREKIVYKIYGKYDYAYHNENDQHADSHVFQAVNEIAQLKEYVLSGGCSCKKHGIGQQIHNSILLF